MEKAKEIVKRLSLDDKVKLISGKDFWKLESVEGLPNIMVTDGPHGLRKQDGETDHAGLNESVKATCYPTAVGLASTWDNELIYQVGEHLGEECKTERVSVLLGPGANIKRHPLCGRNFEYFSEDPFLSGKIAASFINGVQSKGIGTSIKHYVANNQEAMRMAVDTLVDERSLREIYLKGFEIAVKESQPWTVMCSYNKVNGTYLSEHKRLLQDILKDEWGHEGIVVTDWGACNDRVDGLIAGQELEMPGGNLRNREITKQAVLSGKISEELLNERVTRILDLILKSKETLDQNHTPYDKEKHHAFARKVAAETVVLLKNENNILPLNKNQSVALIGDFGKNPRYQGSGSSLINPVKIGNAYDAFKNVLGDKLTYAQGYINEKDVHDEDLLQEAIKTAKEADIAFLMVGLTDTFESEGFDRTHLNIPNNHLKLIEEITKVNKNVIISLSNGSPITMPWKDNVSAIIEQYLGGQASGEALADIVFGEVNPSGKLAETFPNNLKEFPSNQNFPGRPRQVEYREGLYVGYRFYDKANVKPLYPFGYGLSYTTFEYSNITVEQKKDTLKVSYDITNTGKRTGKEISQVYINLNGSKVYRPEKVLKGYNKTEIKVGETKTIKITIPVTDLSIYQDGFKVEEGTYHVLVGSSSQNIHLKQNIKIKGQTLKPDNQTVYHNINKDFAPTQAQFEELYGKKIPDYPAVKPYTLNSVIGEVKGNFIGNRLHKMILKGVSEMFDAEGTDEKLALMAEAMINDLPLRNLIMFSGGAVSHRRAQGLVDLMNVKIFKGLYKVIRG